MLGYKRFYSLGACNWIRDASILGGGIFLHKARMARWHSARLLQMDGILILSVYGLWCLDNQFNTIASVKMREDVEEAAVHIERIMMGEQDSLLKQFLGEVAERGVTRILVESKRMAQELGRIYGVKAVYHEDVELWREVRRRFLGPLSSRESVEFARELSMVIARRTVRSASRRKDQLIVQAIAALDDVEKMMNLMASRLREWYGLHFPEAAQQIDNPLHLAKLIAKTEHREQIIDNPELVKLLPKRLVSILEEGRSMGADIGTQDMGIIRELAHTYLDFHRLRGRLEEYIGEAMEEAAPNLRGLIGPLLGARLISLAGGLAKLAQLPASTIQVLGAERALFRSLRTGARPPKHGVIFQHTLIHSAPWWHRGKIARVLAGKIAIAARLDVYSGQYVADDLKDSVIKRVEEIRRKYPKAPERRRAKPTRGQRKRGRRIYRHARQTRTQPRGRKKR